MQWDKTQVSNIYKTKGQTVGWFFWLIFPPWMKEKETFALKWSDSSIPAIKHDNSDMTNIIFFPHKLILE